MKGWLPYKYPLKREPHPDSFKKIVITEHCSRLSSNPPLADTSFICYNNSAQKRRRNGEYHDTDRRTWKSGKRLCGDEA